MVDLEIPGMESAHVEEGSLLLEEIGLDSTKIYQVSTMCRNVDTV